MKLEAKDLSFRYHKGNRQILNHVSVSLDSKDRLGLAAPSGFGKTTFCIKNLEYYRAKAR